MFQLIVENCKNFLQETITFYEIKELQQLHTQMYKNAVCCKNGVVSCRYFFVRIRLNKMLISPKSIITSLKIISQYYPRSNWGFRSNQCTVMGFSTVIGAQYFMQIRSNTYLDNFFLNRIFLNLVSFQVLRAAFYLINTKYCFTNKFVTNVTKITNGNRSLMLYDVLRITEIYIYNLHTIEYFCIILQVSVHQKLNRLVVHCHICTYNFVYRIFFARGKQYTCAGLAQGSTQSACTQSINGRRDFNSIYLINRNH